MNQDSNKRIGRGEQGERGSEGEGKGEGERGGERKTER